MLLPDLDFDRCYDAVASRDPRFDGWFIVGVTSTGIYCRPSCPAPVRPKRVNLRFFASAAAAQAAGLRACKRCRPDASPGSPDWDRRGDLAGRAMRLIADGVVDREGVGGVAGRLAVSERHLHRVLGDELGAGPLALARASRAQAARTLIETTDLRLADVAFAAGFSSVRQFNDTIRAVFALTPSAMRRLAAGRSDPLAGAGLSIRLAFRRPLNAAQLLGFLANRAVPGVEAVDGATYRRSLRLPGGTGLVSLGLEADHFRCRVRLESIRDLQAAVARCRRLLDLDADPTGVDESLGDDPALAPLVAANPGIRVPGAVDGFEAALRAVLGQQISVSAARTLATRLTAVCGEPLDTPADELTTVFPDASAIAALDPDLLPMPLPRARAVHRLAELVAAGRLDLDPGGDRAAAEAALLAIDGIGPWTASYIRMRAFGDPDVLLATDAAVRRAADRIGLPATPDALADHGRRWSPWRSYATHHLTATLTQETSP